MSLTCALLATMLQQWARRYERVAFPRHRPQKRARIHAFYRRGVEKWHIPKAVEALPLLLHTSLFVFFSGLSTFLYGVNHTIFKVVTTWIGICFTLYACLSIFPITRKDSPYYTPLSGTFSFFLTGIRFLFFRRFPRLIRKQPPSSDPGETYIDTYFSHSMDKTAEKYALELKPDIDHGSLKWTFESLDDEADFEEFFEGLPLLCDSDRDTGEKLELKEKFIEPNKENLQTALIGLMDRTLSSNPVKESVKHRRMVIFTKAMESESTSLLDRSDILRRVLFENWDGLLGCMEFGLSMRNWADNLDKVTITSFYAQCVAALAVSESLVRKRLGHERHGWIQLFKNLPVSTPFHPHVAHEHDDDILLANAIFIVRITVQTYAGSEEGERNSILDVSRRTLRAVCKLDIKKALPELQHEFCDLWTKLVITAQTDELPQRRTIVMRMLKSIRKLYIALHGTTPETPFNTADDWEQILDNSELYPKCTDEHHRSTTSFPALQFNNPPPPTQPVEPTQPEASTPSSPPFPEPHIVTHHAHFSPSSSPDEPPPPAFPDAHLFIPHPAGNSSSPQPVVPTRRVPPTLSAPRFPEPHTPTHNRLLSPPSSPDEPPPPTFPDAQLFVPHPAGSSSSPQPVVPTQPVPPTQSIPRLPEPHTLTHNTLPSSSSSPGQPPPPAFPDAHPFVPPPVGNSSSSHASSVPRGRKTY